MKKQMIATAAMTVFFAAGAMAGVKDAPPAAGVDASVATPAKLVKKNHHKKDKKDIEAPVTK